MKAGRFILAAAIMVFAAGAFAQEELEKLAVYVHGASTGINKTFGNKLLFAIAQNGGCVEIGNSEAFYEELAASYKGDIRLVSQTAAKYGADFVCAVSMTEAFGAYSISARLMRTSDSQVIKTASLDRSIKSLDDLTEVSKELAAQLLGLPPPSQSPAPSNSPASSLTPPASQKECSEKFNINELASKIGSGFPAALKDCSVTLAKNIALSKSPFGKKTPAPEPKSFMMECAIDGIKQKLPPGADEYVKPVQSFVQNLLNAASAGGALDVKKLSSAIGSMNVMDLINELKAKAASDDCASDEPYVPAAEDEDDGGDDSSGDKKRKILSFGIRTGFNFSHWEANYKEGNSGGGEGSYHSIPGFQLGLVLDIAPSTWFHIQPGLYYIQKGAEDSRPHSVDMHYIEVPLLLSLKFSAFRVHAGPYFGICLNGGGSASSSSGGGGYGYGDYHDEEEMFADIGINAGFGFDIGMFYIGVFYELGLYESYYYYSSSYYNYREIIAYNRTLGFNFGINL